MEEDMIDPKKYVVTDQTKISDIDLEVEEFRHGGKRLTEDDAEVIAERVLRGGRPSLSGKSQHSPQVSLRVSPETRSKLEGIAAARQVTVSEVAREAIEQYVKMEASLRSGP
jgi:predicted HicB family RNase H-like nuclease